jgi:hypothetical protein
VTIAERAALGGFRPVDADPEAATLITALHEQASLPAIQRSRATTAELLRPGAETGCSTSTAAPARSGAPWLEVGN